MLRKAVMNNNENESHAFITSRLESLIGTEIVGRNDVGVIVWDTLSGWGALGGSYLMYLDLAGTTSNIELDYEDFTWRSKANDAVQFGLIS